jgi:hypothetical protein
MADSLLKNKHLLWRAGFGIGINQIDDLKNKDTKTLMHELFKEDSFSEISYDTPDDPTADYMNATAPAEKKKKCNDQPGTKQELNLNFLDKMVNSKEQ